MSLFFVLVYIDHLLLSFLTDVYPMAFLSNLKGSEDYNFLTVAG